MFLHLVKTRAPAADLVRPLCRAYRLAGNTKEKYNLVRYVETVEDLPAALLRSLGRLPPGLWAAVQAHVGVEDEEVLAMWQFLGRD